LKRGPNPPKNITEASHRLFDEMQNAFMRRQGDALWKRFGWSLPRPVAQVEERIFDVTLL
jgi:hypothetical protein